MVAMIMQILDTTIANVALPHMQTSLGAAQDTITWVLTSYIVAAAIATPITGWLSDNIGRKRLFMICVVGFVGVLGALRHRHQPRGDGALPHPAGRLRRGAGAALAVGDHGHQPARAAGPGDGDLGRGHHGRADHRPDHRRLAHRQFQLALGASTSTCRSARRRSPASTSSCPTRSAASAASISSASRCCRSPIGAFQFMLDRGEQTRLVLLDRDPDRGRPRHRLPPGSSSSTRSRPRSPSSSARIFSDRNFAAALVFIFIIGIILLATMALLPPMLQNLFGYPDRDGRPGARAARHRHHGLDDRRRPPRPPGRCAPPRRLRPLPDRLLALADDLFLVRDGPPGRSSSPASIQGFGLGFVFIPLSTHRLRHARPAASRPRRTSLFNLVRNLGSSIGISIMAAMLTRNIATSHASLVARITRSTTT